MGPVGVGKWNELLVADLLEVSSEKNDEDIKFLENGLAEHAKEVGAPPLVLAPLSVLKRDEKGVIIGGLCGSTFWDWLYIDSFWVNPAFRKKGLGRALLERAEDEAKKRGCVGVYLITQSFDAPGFYTRLGYKEFAVLADFPVGHTRHYFMKRLAT